MCRSMSSRSCASAPRVSANRFLVRPLIWEFHPPSFRFEINAYVCGLSNMINAVRDRLKSFGWHRKQIIFERYD